MFNAPPGAGKDTVADFFGAQLRHLGVDFKRRALADKPKEMLAYRHGVKVEDMFSRPWKDRPWRNDKTPRQLVIEFSEMQKEVMGQDLWARKVDEEIKSIRRPDVLIVTDLGFDAEFNYFEERHDVILIKIKREGHDYSIDSRKEIHALGREHIINNDGDLFDLRRTSQYLCQQLLGS